MYYTTREITRCALFTALATATAMVVRLGGSMVPFSLLPLIVMLAGTLLGAKLAATSLAAYTLLGLIGLPVFSTPPFGGPSYILRPSFGFVIGFIAAAYIIGLITERFDPQTYPLYLLTSCVGLTVIYLCGLPYLYLIMRFYLGEVLDLRRVIEIGLVPFLIPDLFKAVIAAGITRLIKRRI